MLRKNFKYYIKLIFGLVLFAIALFWDQNYKKVFYLFNRIEFHDIIILLLLSTILTLVSGLKWSLFLKERGHKISLITLFNFLLIGKFFNNFLPSQIGGDFTRIFLLGKVINSQSKSAASVFLERFTGFIALIILAIFFSTLNPKILEEPLIGLSIAGISVLFLILIAFILIPNLMDKAFSPFLSIKFANKIYSKAVKLLTEIRFFKKKYKLLSKAMSYSFLFHFITFVNVYYSCVSIGLSPSFFDIAVITPVILLVTALPVSPNNFGWWEWAFGVLLVDAGFSFDEGLTVALILRLIVFILSIFGGILFLTYKNKKQPYETIEKVNS